MTNARPIIHIVDDDPSFRSAVAELLTAFDYRVALYDSATQLLEKPLAEEPGCILLDLQMAGLNGMQLQDQLTARGVRLPIVFVTGYGDIPTSVRAIKGGAEDFLAKPVPKEKLLAAIGRAHDRCLKLREEDDRLAAMRGLVSRLTVREHEVFIKLVKGLLNKQIAHALGTSERTIKFHRQNIMQKCQVQSLPQLVLIAERLGLVSEIHAGANKQP
jgi:FixJ family two-component response regulator